MRAHAEVGVGVGWWFGEGVCKLWNGVLFLRGKGGQGVCQPVLFK
jgi:hypothetical protein